MDIMDLIKGQLTETVMSQITQQIGASNTQQTANATGSILDVLVGQLAKNAQTQDGSSALANALEKDRHENVMDNLSDFLGGSLQQQAPRASRAANGSGILKHILGDKMGGVADMISNVSGLNTQQSGGLMEILAPIVMGSLGKAKQTNNLDAGGLSDLLGGILNNQRQQRKQSSGNPTMDMLSNFLDKDGDGSIVDDVAGMLGNFLRKK